MGFCSGNCGACPFLTCNYNPEFAVALRAFREPAASTSRGRRFNFAALNHPGPDNLKTGLFHPFSPPRRPNGRLNLRNPEAIL